MSLIRILVADDHLVIRQGLDAILNARNGMKVVGEAANGREAIRLERELGPDVSIIDLLMPEMDGLETTKAIKLQNPQARVLILTSYTLEDRAAEIMAAGASGYLLKDTGADELIQAIRSIHSGHVIMSPMVVQAMSDANAEPQEGQPSPGDLTPRELDVLQGIVGGLTNQAIAKRLSISPTTVRAHVSAILAKLNATNRTQAALIAREQNLL